MNESLERAYEEVKAGKQAAEEMLAFVLKAVGEPVMVTKESIVEGFPPGTTIAINDDLQRDAFVLSLEVVE